jgi:transcriptional regulator with XRE-family HTH domain
MSNNEFKERLKNLVTDSKTEWLADADRYDENQVWLDKSALIALKILRHLRSKNITQKELAGMIDVSPQYISRILKGEENLTLETICKLENVLKVVLVTVPETPSDYTEWQETLWNDQTVEQISEKAMKYRKKSEE